MAAQAPEARRAWRGAGTLSAGTREKTIEDDLFDFGSRQFCRNGGADEAAAFARNGNVVSLGSAFAEQCFLCARAACTSWFHCVEVSFRPPEVNIRSSAWRAIAASMLSPPNIRCSPTAMRRSVGPTSTRVKSDVPPPTSTTRTSRMPSSARSGRADAAP